MLRTVAPEGVDRLVAVAHHRQVAVLGGQQLQQLVLGDVGVLELVHQHVAEALLVGGEHVRVLLEQPHRLQDQVVEVHGVGLGQPPLVEPVGLGGLLLEPAQRPVGRGLGVDQLVLPGAHGVAHGPGRQPLGVVVEPAADLGHQPLGVALVVDAEGGGVAQVRPAAAQHADAGRVEGRHPHRLHHRPDQVPQPFLHLPGRLVGEGDGQHGRGRHPLVLDQVRDPVSTRVLPDPAPATISVGPSVASTASR